jgi:pimeloyl-ACP methyl ester carboxylesterase
MHVTVNGYRLFFDVTGPKLVPDGPRMRERPTVVLLHGGPGGDHSTFKPTFDWLADIAQVVYLDHRGNGRSEYGDPETWILAQWGDDVRAFCETLGIEKPVVLGYSFGGMVAQAYATRHPEHPGRLILYSTTPKVDREEIYGVFERLGGTEARAVAEARWKTPNPATSAAYQQVCSPLYNRRATRNPDAFARGVRNDAVAFRFGAPDGESMRLDFREGLGRIQCPTLVVAGEDDPITPISRSALIASCLPAHLVELVRVPDAGHGIHNDDPALAREVLGRFILG